MLPEALIRAWLVSSQPRLWRGHWGWSYLLVDWQSNGPARGYVSVLFILDPSMPSLSSRLRAGLGVAALSAAALALPACAGICGPRGGCGGKQEQKSGGCDAARPAGCGAKP
jgi:hypothetical protein